MSIRANTMLNRLKSASKYVVIGISFFADLITILSVKYALNRSGAPLTIAFTDISFTKWHLLAFWVIAVYLYVAFLQLYWRSSYASNESFTDFLVKDLVTRFRKPFLLFPALILLIVLFLVIEYWAIIVLVLVFVSLAGVSIAMAPSRYDIDTNILDNTENWASISERIRLLLSERQWINVDDLEDVATTLGVESENMRYAFAKYSSLFPQIGRYAKLYTKEGAVLGKALISVELIDHDEYHY